MSSYTMQLRTYIEKWSQHDEGLSVAEKIEIGREKLFDFDYPLFSENYKKRFETNFIRNFYMREIGFETEGLFKFHLETWLNINMPYFNELFKSQEIKYDPLINTFMLTERDKDMTRDRLEDRDTKQQSSTDGTTTSNSSHDSSSSSETKDDNFNRNVSSDNPDSRLQLQTQQGKGVIEYASGIDESKTDNKETSNGESSTVGSSSDKTKVDLTSDQQNNLKSNMEEMEKFIERRSGKIGIESQAKLIQDYRSALLRVEVQIHKEMQELFMLVY